MGHRQHDQTRMIWHVAFPRNCTGITSRLGNAAPCRLCLPLADFEKFVRDEPLERHAGIIINARRQIRLDGLPVCHFQLLPFCLHRTAPSSSQLSCEARSYRCWSFLSTIFSCVWRFLAPWSSRSNTINPTSCHDVLKATNIRYSNIIIKMKR